jgi:peptide/nickel transport system substrate-binding protein
VRQAVARAVDRQALVAGPLGGHAELIEELVAPPVFGYDGKIPPTPYDAAAARRLLAEAGYANGFAVDLEYMPRKYRAMDAVARALTAQLGRVGIRLRPRPFEASDLLPRVERREPTFYLWGWISTGGDAGVTYDYLVRSPGQGYGVDNGGGYANPEVDRLLEQAAQLLRSDDRRAALQAVARRLHADRPVLPLYLQTDLYAMARDLDFRPRADRRVRGIELRWKPAP